MAETAGEDLGYRVLDSRHRFSGRVFEVVTDTVGMPDGSDAERDLVRHVGAVGVVALDDAGCVVLVRQYRHPVHQRLWELPAGLLDIPGERPLAAARRELAEEAQLTGACWDLLL
ncbi:MAG TPA: NUDIX hydrolase, partial [Micromonosporaceae bacterium]|nr:NUDIX hydrolase [Micromonosporaceae bacterium]